MLQVFCLPVADVIRCLWMMLEVSVLYVRGMCHRKLQRRASAWEIWNDPLIEHFWKTFYWPLLQRWPLRVRRQNCLQEPVLSEQQSRALPGDSHQRNAFLQGPSVHYGSQVQMFPCKQVLREKENATSIRMHKKREIGGCLDVYTQHSCCSGLCCNSVCLRWTPPLSMSAR